MSAKLFWNDDSAPGGHRLGNREPYDGELILKELYLISVKLLCYQKNAFGNDQ